MQGRAARKECYRGGGSCSVIFFKIGEDLNKYRVYGSGLCIKDAVRLAEDTFRKMKRKKLTQFAVTVELPPLNGVRRRVFQLNRWETKTERINRIGVTPFEWTGTNEHTEDTAST